MPPPRKPNPPRKSPTRQSSQRSAAPKRTAAPGMSGAPQTIDPRWLLKALGVVLAIALACAWGTLCLLWYQGQWQLVLHPDRGFPELSDRFESCTELNFAPDATGHPQLNGWICPYQDPTHSAQPKLTGANESVPTILILGGGSDSLGPSLSLATALRSAHVNMLLFSYRGFGQSAGSHPTQDTMQQDAASALTYLTDTQHIPIQRIIPYGTGLGASLAVGLASQHPEIPAVILDAPDGDLTDRVSHDPHSWLIPVRLLFHEDFPLAAPLHTLKTPKLLITYGHTAPLPLANAADPKTTVELSGHDDPAFVPAIQRFVDEYMPANTP